MSKILFTKEQLNILSQNPYVHSVTEKRLTFTKEFKEIFMKAYNAGDSPRKIMDDHGFSSDILGNDRVWSASTRIREEYEKYGEFHEGYGRRSSTSKKAKTTPDQPLLEKDELKQMRLEIDYLKQEIDFLKKISSIKTTRK